MRKRLILLGMMLLALVAAACTQDVSYIEAEVAGAAVKLSWNIDAEAAEYVVERSASGEAGPFQEIARVSDSRYTDTSTQGGVVYSYRVKALSAQGTEVGQTPVVIFTGPTNLLQNASFEDLNNEGRPAGWTTTTYGGQVTHTVGEGRTGNTSARFESPSGTDASYGQKVDLKPDTLYHMSGWIRTVGVDAGTGLGAVISIDELQDVDGSKGARTAGRTGTADWTYVETVFSSENRDVLTVLLLFGGWGQSSGTVEYDDLALVEYEKVRVTADE